MHSKNTSYVELMVSHRVPPQVAHRGMLITYIGGGYWGNKIFRADQNRCWCPAATVEAIEARGMGPQQKTPWSSWWGLHIRLTTLSCKNKSVQKPAAWPRLANQSDPTGKWWMGKSHLYVKPKQILLWGCWRRRPRPIKCCRVSWYGSKR
jgi:hypothetical protein